MAADDDKNRINHVFYPPSDKLIGIFVNMTESQQKKPDLGLLEEDDEFEEFPAEGVTSWLV